MSIKISETIIENLFFEVILRKVKIVQPRGSQVSSGHERKQTNARSAIGYGLGRARARDFSRGMAKDGGKELPPS